MRPATRERAAADDTIVTYPRPITRSDALHHPDRGLGSPTSDDHKHVHSHVRPLLATRGADADFHWDPDARARAARQRLDELCPNRVAALETLDANRRAYVTGRAGTGKTRLAMGWVRRAFVADERALLTCYPDPLAAGTRAQLPDDERLVIGGFLRVAIELDGIPPLPIPPDADHEWWTTDAVAHLRDHWHHITERFDLS